MRILIIRMYPDVLNIESYNCQEIGLAKALIRKGNQCDVVLYTDKNENWEDDVYFDDGKKIHIYYLKAKSIFKNAFFDKILYSIIKSYDIIQTSEYDQIGNLFLRKKLGDKLMIYHGPYECEFTKGYKMKCIISDFIFKFFKDYKNTKCLSKSVLAMEFLKNKGFKKISMVGVGLDEDRFKSNNKDKSIEIIENKGTLQYLLYVGKVEERRNVLLLIDILKEILVDNENVRLLIIGKGEKKYMDKCIMHAKNLGIDENIIYIESMNQEMLPQVYQNCDVFLLPTKYEIFGMVLLEAMYFGIPVVTTYNGGSSVLIKNKENGCIVKNESVSEWKKVIEDIIYDREYRLKLSRNAKETIKNNYMWDNLVEEFYRFD